MKPGYKTSEWWGMLLACVVGLLMASGLVVEGSIWSQALGIIASALASAGYSISRGMAKMG